MNYHSLQNIKNILCTKGRKFWYSNNNNDKNKLDMVLFWSLTSSPDNQPEENSTFIFALKHSKGTSVIAYLYALLFPWLSENVLKSEKLWKFATSKITRPQNPTMFCIFYEIVGFMKRRSIRPCFSQMSTKEWLIRGYLTKYSST